MSAPERDAEQDELVQGLQILGVAKMYKHQNKQFNHFLVRAFLTKLWRLESVSLNFTQSLLQSLKSAQKLCCSLCLRL